MRKLLVPLVLTLLVTACATPVTNRPEISDAEVRREVRLNKELAVKQFVKDVRRLYKVSYPVMKHNASQCQVEGSKIKGVKPTLGFSVWNRYAIAEEYREALMSTHKVGSGLRVQAVAKNTPASRAGVREGDRVVSVNGQEFSTKKTAYQEFDDAVELAKGNAVKLVLKRNDKEITKTIIKEEVCEYPILLDYESTAVNAYTDGQKIVMSKGLIRFADSDTEIALVVSHELAHITMGHVDKQKQNAMIGVLGGLVLDIAAATAGVDTGGEFGRMGGGIAGTRYSVEFEQEADYVGMYYLARAGYSTKNVGDFWRRMAIESPSQMKIRTTHPTSPERFLAIQHTHDEITSKLAKKQKLLPNLKPKD